ncbi:MAG: phosphoenolpyruvate--protein phosphotransferase [Termitinemataceae bacterium]|nr:MAG: phosphoenolpyruvate--protein phosphotransferase [Termitinemataceae bacterium]
MKKLKGICASSGLASARALVWYSDEEVEIPKNTINKTQVQLEWQRLEKVKIDLINTVKDQIESAKKENADDEQINILKSHLMMLQDEVFFDGIKKDLENQKANIEWVLWSASNKMVQLLSSSKDPVLRERSADISDMAGNIIGGLLLKKGKRILDTALNMLSQDVIIVASDIPPFMALSMNKTHVKAIVLELGTKTSHTAILARSLGLPTIVGCKNACKEIQTGDYLLVDAGNAEVVIDPKDDVVRDFQTKQHKKATSLSVFEAEKNLDAVTLDGKIIKLFANIEDPKSVKNILENYKIDGIGLFRSEFLFLAANKILDEEEQYKAYSELLLACGELPVTIRTLDLGADKIFSPDSNLNIEKEANPLLGCRGIRLSLLKKDIFKTQLRAILRASIHGKVQIMFPMISTIDELIRANEILREVKKELKGKNIKFAKGIKVGIMIEVPSAAITADSFAPLCDFFSIGTNDLAQYTMAADRENATVADIASYAQPALLRLIKRVIKAAYNEDIPVSICGEMASDEGLTHLLLSLGLSSFSMSAASIPSVKHEVRSFYLKDLVNQKKHIVI